MANQNEQNMMKVFSRVAKKYDLLNTILSFGQDRIWRKISAKRTMLAPQSNENPYILDLAAGTLDLSIEMNKAHPNAKVLSFDLSKEMLAFGLHKIGKKAIYPALASAYNLPLKDSSMSCATVAFGLRNMTDRKSALTEIKRTLMPRAKVYILEFNSGSNPIMYGIYNIYLKYLLPLIGALISKNGGEYKYLASSINSFPTPNKLQEEMKEIGYKHVEYIKLYAGILGLYIGEKEIDN